MGVLRMMNTWDNFVSLVMAKELLAEAGEDELQIAEQCYKNKNATILQSLLNIPDYDSDEDSYEDWFELGIDRSLAEKAKVPAREQYLHYFGFIKGPVGSVCKSFDVDADGITQRISISNQTKLQKYFFSENEGVHIYAEKSKTGLVARYVINEDIYQVAKLFKGPDFGTHLVGEYLQLSSAEQTAYSLLASNKELRRTILYALSYLATYAIVSRTYSDDVLRVATEHFNTCIRQKYGCLEVKPELVSVCAKDLFGSEQIDLSMDHLAPALQADYTFSISNKLLPFTLFAITNGFSAWHEQGLSTTQIIIEKLAASKRRRVIDALCTMTHPSLVNAVLTEVVEACSSYPQHNGAFNDMLFQILSRCKHLEAGTIQCMCDFMFKSTIYQDQVQHIHNVICGPNGEAFRSYIMGSYLNGYENKVAEFQFCAAAITNAERHNNGINPLDYALTHISAEEQNAEWLLDVMCLGILAWDGRIDHANYSVKNVSLSQEIVNKLVPFLSTPDKLFFPIISCTIHDLILNEVLEPNILGEAERQAALQVLSYETYRRRAEELLSLIPAPATENSTCTQSNLVSSYMQRYEACHQDPKSEENCEVLLAVLFHLGVFPTLAERQEQLNRVMLRSISSRVFNDNSNKWRLGNLLYNNGLGPHFWTEYSTQTDPATLDCELSDGRKAELIQLSKELTSANQTYTVSNTQEALDIIKFIKPYTYEKHTQHKAEPANLGSHIILEPLTPGSYIIVNWFEILCRYASGERVLAFYHTHREVLDRPTNLVQSSLQGGRRGFYEAYKAILRGKSRVSSGLCKAITGRNLDVISTFMQSEYCSLVDNKGFVGSFIDDVCTYGTEDDVAAIHSLYEGRYGTDVALERVRAKYPAKSFDLLSTLDRIDRLIEEMQRKDADSEPRPSESYRPKRPLPPEILQPIEAPASESGLSAIRKELEYYPSEYYDDRTIQIHTLLKNPFLNHLVMRLGFDDDRDMIKLAISVNGENLTYASSRLKEDNEICLMALQQTGLALPYVKGSIRNETQLIKPLLLSTECVLQGIPAKYCNDPDIVLHAVRRDHTQLQYASESLRANRTVVSAVVCQPHKNKTVPAAVKWISDELKDDTELMLQAVKANPQAYTYISPRLKQDPAILALPHKEKAMDSDDIATKIQKMIDEL